ncbi:MAG: hypothetical protein GY870_20445 [archaeon]|nr:hypothetical protein [archaeon]
MKILIIYNSSTGNTEKVAHSMKEELDLKGQDITLVNVKEADSSTLKNFDLLILGSGILGGKIGKPLIKTIKEAAELPSKFAFFITYGGQANITKAFKRIKKIIDEKGGELLGELSILGENKGMSKEAQVSMFENLPPEQKEKALKHLENMKGRPNEEDLNRAKKFVNSLI